MKTKVILFLLLTSSILSAQQKNAFYIGHSLSDQIPDMVKSLSDDMFAVDFDWAYQSIPGAPLRWQWDRKINKDYNENPPYYYAFYSEEGGLPTGEYNVLVLTESVPRYWSIIGDTYQYADSLVAYALSYNPNIQIYLYEDWHCIKSGTPTGCDYDIDANPWRQRLDDDLAMWESVVDTLNNRFNPTNPVCMIPAGQGLARLYDAIEEGTVPGISSIEDIFSDNIHLTDVGKYFVACVHFAMIHNTSPVGLTNQTQVWWGGDFDPPTEDQARVFQEIAWETVNSYERSCLNTSTTTVENMVENEEIKYNTFTNTLTIPNFSNEELTIYNLFGQLVLTSTEDTVNLSILPNGVYFVSFGNKIQMIIR